MSQHFLVEYLQTGSAETREEKRGEHIAYRKSFGNKIILADPLLGENNKPNGSVIIIEADDAEAAKAMATNDPFVRAELLKLTSIKAMRVVAVNPPA